MTDGDRYFVEKSSVDEDHNRLCSLCRRKIPKGLKFWHVTQGNLVGSGHRIFNMHFKCHDWLIRFYELTVGVFDFQNRKNWVYRNIETRFEGFGQKRSPELEEHLEVWERILRGNMPVQIELFK